MKHIYLISGPAGAGKSTTSRRLAETFDHSAYIQGDTINHMIVGGYRPPWEDEDLLSLTWKNIADLSINFLLSGKAVIIDYVAFPHEAAELAEQLKARVQGVEVNYVVLWVEKEELLRRDALRVEESQMGERCLELLHEFENAPLNHRFFYDTSGFNIKSLDRIVDEIKSNSRFIWGKGDEYS
ncbi:AAA family ATPase [Halobacillus sp. A5]|uniref:AAA family ATPase n=1 Tax=Halobacillus sp. A5 TaxID=2880263 RepID=UPI0020A6B1F7|nr:AAA family ATPase [Halobacillus sp. A5]MCP3028460.1 AAA family ATPase [Halobacillus sp. A5]